MTSSLFPQVVGELERSFDIDPGTATPDTTFEALGLDSLALLELVTRYEDEHGAELSDDAQDRLSTTSTLADVCAVLEQCLPGSGGAATGGGSAGGAATGDAPTGAPATGDAPTDGASTSDAPTGEASTARAVPPTGRTS
ncbi:acyl carrier protein [Streptomyces sp. NPDC003077]|uniref:acyl carrier protein n=1 Tax=Streptomyces sp. NPDC003077 TaxID=3154443 RepID=UPI0033B573C6